MENNNLVKLRFLKTVGFCADPIGSEQMTRTWKHSVIEQSTDNDDNDKGSA